MAAIRLDAKQKDPFETLKSWLYKRARMTEKHIEHLPLTYGDLGRPEACLMPESEKHVSFMLHLAFACTDCIFSAALPRCIAALQHCAPGSVAASATSECS
jgi:hypothetical protein